MSIQAKIILDSVNPVGNRLTTWVLTYPRWILAEINTHRALSRNTSSSRAIPVSKLIEAAKTNPAMPVFWGKNQAGMQASEELTGNELDAAKKLWLEGRDNAVRTVEQLNAVGLHKQTANRILEPWLYVTSLVSGTEWQNFFALRAHKDAQPEFQKLAYLMLDLYQQSQPKQLNEGEWHIPFGDALDHRRIWELVQKSTHEKLPDSAEIFTGKYFNDENVFRETALKIATARCARVSYLNFDGKDDYEADIALAERLAASGHWSPFEHCATPAISGTIPHRSGNFVGWKQYRKFFAQENRTDGRVGGPEYNGGAANY
jgi:thymidylate synthase ThyX